MSAAGEQGALPNLLLVGAMSCGTTAAHNLLARHPEVQMSEPKELNYFLSAAGADLSVYADPVDRGTVGARRNWERGPGWYRSHFDPGSAVRGESSPAYCAPHNRESVARIAETLGSVRILMMVRDPLECMISQYRHLSAGPRERRAPERALADPEGIYAMRARFAAQLEPFLRAFGADRVGVITSEALRADPEAALETAWDLLGLDPPAPGFAPAGQQFGGSDRRGERVRLMRRLPYSPRMRWAYRIPAPVRRRLWSLAQLGAPRSPRAELSERVRSRLREALAADAERLRALTGIETPGWCV